MLAARDEGALKGVRAEIQDIGSGIPASCHPLDVTDAAAVRKLVSSLASEHWAIRIRC